MPPSDTEKTRAQKEGDEARLRGCSNEEPQTPARDPEQSAGFPVLGEALPRGRLHL